MIKYVRRVHLILRHQLHSHFERTGPLLDASYIFVEQQTKEGLALSLYECSLCPRIKSTLYMRQDVQCSDSFFV